VGHVLGYSILRKFERYVREGRLMDSLQTLAALAPVALSLAPYLAAFSSQHKDEPFLQALADHFPAASHLKQASDRKAWITDTFCEFNGVCRTIKTLAGVARKTGKPLTVITCLDQIPPDPIDVKAFRPVGTFPLPEYEVHELSFPPFLDVIEYIERNQFNELIISTPGPLGLTALAAAKLLGIRTTGIYHTDFPMIARCLTDDPAVEQLTWKYMQWFYDSVDWVVAPSEYYRRHLVRHGFDPARLSVLVRGVDRERFNPTKRDEAFWDRYGLARGFKFLYVGRVSADKQVELVLTSFQKLAEQGREASLAIVGDGPSLEELRRRHQDPRIAFTGFLDGEELATAVASADVLVFPSTTDTFGNAVLEAQASGLPAIVSNRGGPQEIVTTHGSGVVVDVAEPGAVAQAMDRLLGDSDLRGDMRRRALRNAAGRGWEQVLDELWNHEDHGARSAPIVDYSQATLQPDPGEIAADVA